MNIDVYEVIQDASTFTSAILPDILKKRRGHFSIKEFKLLQSENILTSDIGKDYVDNMILGAIVAYHEQLRNTLLEKGIDIGDISVGGSLIE